MRDRNLSEGGTSEGSELEFGYLSERALLARFAKSRDARLREELVRRFTGLAKSMALRYRSSPENIEDLTQIALMALVTAIDRYQPERGEFKSYAVSTILGELRHHLRDRVSPLRLQRRLQELIMRVNEATDVLTTELGRSPTAIELARHCEVPLEDIIEAVEARHARRRLSLDNPFASEEGDQTAPVDRLAHRDMRFDQIEASLSVQDVPLTARERTALRLYYVERMKQREIGEVLGLSQMQVSRVVRGALLKMLDAVRGGDAAEAAG